MASSKAKDQPATMLLANEYDQFATSYAENFGREFCQNAMPILENLILGELPAGAHVLDLCCGPGLIASQLIARGFEVTGIDDSESMLEIARRNAPKAKFLKYDIRHFHSAQKFDAAISTFNSLAHVRSTELTFVFDKVAACLQPGAKFVFDLTMQSGYEQNWRGSFAFVRPDEVCIVRPFFSAPEQKATNYITLFRKDGGSCWARNDFEVAQNCHHEDLVKAALKLSGFQNIRGYPGEGLGMEETGRMFFSAQSS